MFCHFLVLILCKGLVSNSFLLGTSTPAPHVGGPVLTDTHNAALIELLLDEKQHRYQLEQRVTALEHAGSKDQSDKISQLEHYVLKLEDRVKQLEDNVSVCSTVTIDSIQRSEFVNESAIMTRRYEELETRYDDLEKKYEMTNKTVKQFQNKVLGLEQLRNINQIQTINALQHEVQSLNTKTNMLIMNGNARAQDFLAMYNKTVSIETFLLNKVHQVGKELNETSASQFSHLSNYIHGVDNRENISTSNLKAEVVIVKQFIHTVDKRLNTSTAAFDSHISNLQVKLKELERQQNTTNGLLSKMTNTNVTSNLKAEVVIVKQFIQTVDKRLNTSTAASDSHISNLRVQLQELQRQQNTTTGMLSNMTKTNVQVAVTSCLVSSGAINNEVAKFSNVKLSVGISNISLFTTNGMFSCEHAGLYIVSLTLDIGPGESGYIYIMKNGNQFYKFLEGSIPAQSHTITGMTSVQLDKNDTLSVKINSKYVYASDWSCATIVRIS